MNRLYEIGHFIGKNLFTFFLCGNQVRLSLTVRYLR